MADEIKVIVNLDELSIGDLEDLESGSITRILRVFDHVITTEGGDLRSLHYTKLREIAASLREQVELEVSPEVDGKN